MTDRRMFRITATNRRHVAEQVANLPEGWTVQAKPSARTLDQNAAQWPLLEQFSREFQWPVNGVMSQMTKEEWKDVLTAAFEKETMPRLASGIDGGVVMIGKRTSQFSKAKFSDWLEFLNATYALLKQRAQQN